MSTWLLAGLGNPGPEYERTRHNVGFMIADELARRARASFSAPRGMRASVAETVISAAGVGVPPGDKLVLTKPRTFMNESGQAVGKLASFFKVPPDHVIIAHDEIDLEFGQLRAKFGGGDNGHNGLKSVRAHLRTGDFYRVRFGVGRPTGHHAAAGYVLDRFPASMREDLAVEVQRAADACETLMTEGLPATQNKFNS
ncbi:aminoacyl-tRNA hydrolase [Propionimicrobium sp. PCR01-08-3]|uniref:aminoacyl-tRNA hydrolase n=1 Tax=Propionimicrobium sp. PCR01-08-3 TaxID=3052086 RepID=UPI00255C8791|nr:aminoacyl-tRNA hydrolase [Propionimicrobium sp. PCR01-08-3]WIY83029.1 aminoacyl-tRNA hydrolase [Propionimicrobium sp. PCR01-08-3]